MKEASPELARIVAHICGDGYICTAKQQRSPKELLGHPRINTVRNKWYVRYVNTEPALVKQFKRDVKREFNRRVVALKSNEYEISGKWVYELVTRLGAGKSRNWFIAKEFISASDDIKLEWLRALFDDEAYVSIKQKRIVLNMVNKKGLEQIKKLLNEFNIQSTLNGPYRYKNFESYHLLIYHDYIKIFAGLIGFNHPKKKVSLNKIKLGTQGISEALMTSAPFEP
jgi:hypothetical protein